MKIVARGIFAAIIIICLVVIVQFLRWGGAGTHGSIKSYQYPVTKYDLEMAVKTVMGNSTNLKRDISYYYYAYDSINKITSGSVDSTPGSVKLFDSSHNDGKRYLRINIFQNGTTYEYVFQFAGTELDWRMDNESCISIAYAYDDDANGGSEGNGGFNFKWGLKRRLTKIFETEFISKIDKQLGKTHTIAD